MAALNPLDSRLVVTFYVATTKGRAEEWVKILNPVDNSEHHARAASMSHRDPATNEDVSYAERFPQQYAAFRSGKDKSLADKEADLERELAAVRSARQSPVVTDAQLAKATDAAQAAAREEAARNAPAPDFEAMSDDDLRDYIAEHTGKTPGGNTKRETLIRAAQEI